MKQSPIFIKTYETMVWVMGRTAKFPKNYRFLLGMRMENCLMDFIEGLGDAARLKCPKEQSDVLGRMDILLGRLKLHGRLAKDLQLISLNQYEYLSERLDEVGRLLGGWQRRLHKGSQPASAD